MADDARDTVVVGAGPNGLAAAITLARSGRSVLVLEAQETIGGGTRTAELTLPGFRHDVCSAIHPMALASPFFRSLPLAEHGLEFIHPPAPLAHPFDDGTAAVLERSVEATADSLAEDADAYCRLIGPLVEGAPQLVPSILRPPLWPPRHPLLMARFGLDGVRSAVDLASARFAGERARALLAGSAAHSTLSLYKRPSASFALVLTLLGHAVGWPIPSGGSQAIADALASYLRSLGGEIVTGRRVESIDELPPAGAVLLDLTPRQVARLAGHRLPRRYRRGLERYRYGAGVFKVDFALDGPVPWSAAECARAGTIHLGATMDEIAASEHAVSRGEHARRPYVLVAQQSLFDPTRAPAGKHALWAYCHVPNGSTFDMTAPLEDQVERFAPGFRDRILARSVMAPAELERHNANLVGGDINGGIQDLAQLFARPLARAVPYATATKGIFICSSSTPPGGAVHGMCGHLAARAALRSLARR